MPSSTAEKRSEAEEPLDARRAFDQRQLRTGRDARALIRADSTIPRRPKSRGLRIRCHPPGLPTALFTASSGVGSPWSCRFTCLRLRRFSRSG